MAGANPSTGGDNEVEYIPFYGELRMTTFTTEDRKEAAKKPKKEKVVLKQSAPEVAEQEIVKARTEAVVEEIKTSKMEAIKQVLEHSDSDEEIIAAIEQVIQPDVPEPGVTGVATSPSEADVTRRGFTTIHMARAAKNNNRNPEDYLIVELRDVQGAVLAYYVTHKRDEL